MASIKTSRGCVGCGEVGRQRTLNGFIKEGLVGVGVRGEGRRAGEVGIPGFIEEPGFDTVFNGGVVRGRDGTRSFRS